MHARRIKTTFSTAFALSAGLVGCGGGAPIVPTGPLTVSWFIGGSTCTQSGLSTVELTVSDLSGPVDSASVACQVGSYVFRSVPAGRYRVDLAGYPDQGSYPTYEGAVASVDVRANVQNITPKVPLAQKPGSIDLVWRFDNGQLCSYNDVDSVDVTVWDAFSNQVAFDEYPCDLSKLPASVPAATQTDAIPAPVTNEPVAKGLLLGDLPAGTYTVSARAKNSRAVGASFWAEAKATVKQARSAELQLVLQSCSEKPNSNLCGL